MLHNKEHVAAAIETDPMKKVKPVKSPGCKLAPNIKFNVFIIDRLVNNIIN